MNTTKQKPFVMLDNTSILYSFFCFILKLSWKVKKVF